MFKERLLTALVLIPIVIFAIYYGNIWVLSAVVLLLMLALGFEWMALIPLNHVTEQCVFGLCLLLALLPSLYALNIYLFMNWFVWGAILIALLSFPFSQRYWGNRTVVCALCLFILPTFLSSLNALLRHQHGRGMLLYLLLLVWAVDIGAYLVGKKWGQHKLIPHVSPGKSWEGVAGGIGLALLVACGGYYDVRPESALKWFLSALFIVLISMIGDLFVSMLKRRCQVKDTGRLLPGHGGLLDRLDSLIAALPFFYSVYLPQF